MIDEFHSGIGVIAESNLLVHEYLVGEGIEGFGLLVLRRIGFGGVRGAAKGVVFRWAPEARLKWCRKGGDGESEDG